MIRFNAKSRTLVIRLPSWRDRRWLYAVGLFVLLDLLASFVDRPLAQALSQLGPEVTRPFQYIARASDAMFYAIPLTLVLPFLLAARQALNDGSLRRVLGWGLQGILFVLACLTLSAVIVDVLQGIIGRTRPNLWFMQDIYGFAPFSFGASGYNSFPSGHSATVFAVGMAFGLLMPPLRRLFLSLAALVVASPLIINSHYLTDLLVGGTIAVLVALGLRHLFAKRGWVFLQRHGQYRLAAPGYWLGVKIRSLLWERLGLSDGARGRLP